MSDLRVREISKQLQGQTHKPNQLYIRRCLQQNPTMTAAQILRAFKDNQTSATGGGGARQSVRTQVRNRYTSIQGSVSPLTSRLHQVVPVPGATCRQCDKPATQGGLCALHKPPKEPKKKKTKSEK